MIPPFSIWFRKRPGKKWPGCDVPAEIRLAYAEGRLNAKPCIICGTDQQAHAHHLDYSKPLDVVFLCQRHHMRFHYLLGNRFWRSAWQRYSQQFHDRVLWEVQREFLEPELPLFEVLPWRHQGQRIAAAARYHSPA
jgi:hypothetical protein